MTGLLALLLAAVGLPFLRRRRLVQPKPAWQNQVDSTSAPVNDGAGERISHRVEQGSAPKDATVAANSDAGIPRFAAKNKPPRFGAAPPQAEPEQDAAELRFEGVAMSPGEIPDQTEIASPGSPGDLDIAELALDGADNKSAVALAAEMLQIDEVVPADRLGFVDDGRAAEQFGLSRIPELAPSREQSQLPPANWDPDRISRKVSEPDASAYVTTTLGAGPAAAGAAKLDRQGSQMPPSQTPTPVAFEFTAEKCGATLVNAVLRYQLKVRSEAIETISDLTIYGDMVEAGGVSSARELLPVDQADMPLIGHVQWLEPGAEAVLSGEIRVPLAAMKPIEANGRLIIVPVARFAAVGDRFAPHIRAYIIGQESVPPTTKLGPFRLDLGPRNFKSVGQRPLEIA